MNLIFKRGLAAGFVNLIVGLAISFGVSAIFPGLAAEYQNTAIFRPWDDPLMMLFFGYPFLLGIVLAYFWGLVGKEFKGETGAKALEFAKLYFLIATIPGMFITLSSFQISYAMIALWTITGFIEAYIAGWIFSSIKK